MNGTLQEPIRCWVKRMPYDLLKGVEINAVWNDVLKWWEVTFTNKGQTITAITTDWPKVRKGRK